MPKSKGHTSGSNLSLADLIPERDTFTDEFADDPNATGKVYEFVARVELSEAQTARAIALSKRIELAIRKIEKNPSNPLAQKRLSEFTLQMLRIIMPDMPLERVNNLSFGQRTAIIEWWRKRNEQTSPNGGDPNDEEWEPGEM